MPDQQTGFLQRFTKRAAREGERRTPTGANAKSSPDSRVQALVHSAGKAIGCLHPAARHHEHARQKTCPRMAPAKEDFRLARFPGANEDEARGIHRSHLSPNTRLADE